MDNPKEARPLFTEEEFEDASDDTEFEIELGEPTSEEPPLQAEPEPETEDESEDEDEPEAEDEGYAGLSDDEKQHYGKRAQKRIQQLVSQKKEADEKLRELQSSVVDLQRNQATFETKARQTDEQLLNDYISHNEESSKSVMFKLRKAKEDGDIDAELSASEELASIKAEGLLLKQYKQQYSGMKEAEAAEGARDVTPPASVDPQVLARERQRAYQWMRSNPWFRRSNEGDDRERTLAAEQIHHALISEGHRPLDNPDEYYAELDARLASEFPEDSTTDNKGRKKVTQKVAGGSPRTATNGKSIKAGGKTRVSLTKSEIATARSLDIPLEEYAKQKYAIQQRA